MRTRDPTRSDGRWENGARIWSEDRARIADQAPHWTHRQRPTAVVANFRAGYTGSRRQAFEAAARLCFDGPVIFCDGQFEGVGQKRLGAR